MKPKRIFVGQYPATRAYAPDGTLVYGGGDDLTAGSLPGGWSIARASSAWRWNAGTIGSVSTDVSRFAADPRTNAGLGLMLEPAGTNLIPANRYRDLSAWTLTGSPVITTVPGIDGTTTASRITATADNTVVSLALTSSLNDHTFSAWVRRQTGDRRIDISIAGDPLNITAQLLDPNEWVRVHWNKQSTNPTVAFLLAYSGDAIDVDFCQCETGVGPTSEITGGATRAAETLTLPLFGAVTYADIIAQYPVIGLERRCVIDRIVDHATKPVFTFAAQRMPLGGFIELDELSVELT